MGDWGSLEKILTGGAVALALSVFAAWKLWSRYTLVADRELKFKEEKIETLTTALNNNTNALNNQSAALLKMADEIRLLREMLMGRAT